MREVEKVEELCGLASAALSVQQDVELFVARTDEYLEEFELLQQSYAEHNPLSEESKLADAEKDQLRVVLQNLELLHHEIMKLAGLQQEKVAADIADANRRAFGMKKYIDHLPSRISITGRRKG